MPIATTSPQLTTYVEAQAVLGTRRTRKIANNTYLERRDDECIAVRLHETDVVTFYPNGNIELQTGGWNTHITRERLNRYTPDNVSVYTVKHVLYIAVRFGSWENALHAEFTEGEVVVTDETGRGVDLRPGFFPTSLASSGWQH